MVRIVGRFLLPDGEPAEGVVIQTWTTAHPGSHGEWVKLPAGWKEPGARTGVDGRFELPVDTRVARGGALVSSRFGFVPRRWYLEQYEPGATEDLGTITLQRAGALRVKVVRPDGEFASGSWRASLRWSGPDADDVHGAVVNRMSREFNTGAWIIDDLPPGPVRVDVESPVAGQVSGPTVVIVTGETVTVEVPYDGPDAARMITLRVRTKRFGQLDPEREHIRLIGPGTTERGPEALEANGLEWVFTDLPAGTYRLRIDDPRFELWERSGLQPGSNVTAQLIPSAAIDVQVIDDATDEELKHFQLTLRTEQGYNRREYELHAPWRELPEDGVFQVPPGSYVLTVEAEGRGAVPVELDGLQAGEVRPVTVRLARMLTLRGRVVRADDETPVDGALVHIREPGAEPVFGQLGMLVTRAGVRIEPIAALLADESGRFELELAPGRYALHGMVNAWTAGVIDPLVIPPSGIDDEVLVRLPAASTLVGTLVGGDPSMVEGLTVSVRPLEDTSKQRPFVSNPEASIDASGSFRVELLPPGPVSVTLHSTTTDAPLAGMGSFMTHPVDQQLGEVELAANGVTEAEFEMPAWPGRFSVQLQFSGQPAEDLVVTLRSTAEERPGNPTCVTDAQGKAELRGLPPGDYQIHARPTDASWEADLGVLHLASGEDATLEHNVELATGRVQLVEAGTGEPLAETMVYLHYQSMHTPVVTDTEGWIELTLPARELAIECHPPLPRWSGTLHWSPAGPIEDRVVMTVAE